MPFELQNSGTARYGQFSNNYVETVFYCYSYLFKNAPLLCAQSIGVLPSGSQYA